MLFLFLFFWCKSDTRSKDHIVSNPPLAMLHQTPSSRSHPSRRSSKPTLPCLCLYAILLAQPIRLPWRRTPRLAISLPPARASPPAIPTPLISPPPTTLPPRLTPCPRILTLIFIAAPALCALCALGQRLIQALDEGGAGVGGGGAEFLGALEGFEGFGGGGVGGAEALGAFLALEEFVVEGGGRDAGGEVGGWGFGLCGFFFGEVLVGRFGDFSSGFGGGFGGSRGSFSGRFRGLGGVDGGNLVGDSGRIGDAAEAACG